jgi:GNAT superfamily N-acetyltransferase
MASSVSYFAARRQLIEGPGLIDSGAWPISFFRTAKGWGNLPEDYWPGQGLQLGTSMPNEPPNADEIAKTDRLVYYQRLRTEFECLYAALYTQLCSAAVGITKAWREPPNGVIPRDGGNLPVVAIHSIGIIDFDLDMQGFVFPNTWGREWGNDGLGLLPFGYLSRFLVEAWTAPVRYLPPKPTKPGIDIRMTEGEESKLGTPWIVDIMDGDNDVMVGWAHVIQSGKTLNVEELFVRPDYRGRGHGTALVNEIRRIAPEGYHVNFWIPWGDHTDWNKASLLGWLRKNQLKVEPSKARWAAYLATDGAPVESLPTLDWIPTKAMASVTMLGDNETETATEWGDNWTDAKATRRAELVEKKYLDSLSLEELEEFELLQEEFGQYQDAVAPLPSD